MARDIGRKRCYLAEAGIFGGHYFEKSCTARRLNEAEARAFHVEVVAYCRKTMPKLQLPEFDPKFEISKANHSFYQWGRCVYLLRNLTDSCVMHEVAHWACPGQQHGKVWQRAFAALLSHFYDQQTGDKFLKLCETLPVLRVAGPKQRWILQEQDPVTREWRNSERSRKLIPNAQKLAMWRGDYRWVAFGKENVCLRMRRDV